MKYSLDIDQHNLKLKFKKLHTKICRKKSKFFKLR